MFTCTKSLNGYNLRHNNCILFSIFLYFKYRFLLNSFVYKSVHAIQGFMQPNFVTTIFNIGLS